MHPTAPQNVLVATDLGPSSETAIRFAAELAGATGARLTLFHAIAPLLFFDFGGWDPHAVQIATEKQMEHAALELRRLGDTEMSSALEIDTEVRDVYPVKGVLDAARERQCDLIVLGTHAWGPVTSFFLGSVTHGVLHQSEVPVITVRPRTGEEDRHGIRTILCPVNFSDAARAAVLWAGAIADATGAELQILHLIEPGGDGQSRSIADWLPEGISQRNVRTLIHHGHAAEEVVRHVAEHDIDLIVVGATHKRFADTTVLGTTAERIIRHSPAAVMTITLDAAAGSARQKSGAA